jgi:hypothetical protein
LIPKNELGLKYPSKIDLDIWNVGVERYHLHISATCPGKYQDPFMAPMKG